MFPVGNIWRNIFLSLLAPAAASCVETLRQEGYTGRIVMISKEPYLPYDRTKLSKVNCFSQFENVYLLSCFKSALSYVHTDRVGHFLICFDPIFFNLILIFLHIIMTALLGQHSTKQIICFMDCWWITCYLILITEGVYVWNK